jgi:hypothetical protein
MGDRSVITLQVGNYANFVGAHFWNIQVRKKRLIHLNTGPVFERQNTVLELWIWFLNGI